MIRLTFAPHSEVNGAALVKLVGENSKYMKLIPGKETALLFRTGNLEIEPLDWLGKTLPKMLK